jgi:hypothetical protein
LRKHSRSRVTEDGFAVFLLLPAGEISFLSGTYLGEKSERFSEYSDKRPDDLDLSAQPEMQRNVSLQLLLDRGWVAMEQGVTITRTDAGATTAVMSSGYEWSKSYTSWDQALDEAVDLQSLNKVESAAAKMMPPGFPAA